MRQLVACATLMLLVVTTWAGVVADDFGDGDFRGWVVRKEDNVEWSETDDDAGWRENGCRKMLASGGHSIHIGNEPPHHLVLKEGRWYKAKIIAAGNHYECFVNGDLICQFDAASPSKGPAYISARNGDFFFDNARISGDTITDLNLSVDAKGKLAAVWGGLKSSSAL